LELYGTLEECVYMTTTNQVTALTSAPTSQGSNPVGGLGITPSPSAPTVTPALHAELTQAHADFVSFHEEYVRHYISLADTKATMIFGATAGLLTYLFSQSKFHDLILSPALTAEYTHLASTTLLLILSAFCASLVVAPRLAHTGEGIVFFGSVAKYPSSLKYLEHVANQNETKLTAARIQHSYDVSKTCVRKYDMLRRSFWLGCLGIISSLLVLGTL
jgi:hypothetical protein